MPGALNLSLEHYALLYCVCEEDDSSQRLCLVILAILHAVIVGIAHR